MKVGFGRCDITPRVGVELSGFGPFLNRHSVGIHDRLFARAMAVEHGGERLVIVSCDLIGIPLAMTRRVRALLDRVVGLRPEAVLVHCTHTHSGPAPGVYIGWGDPDPPYLEILPQRIAAACRQAVTGLREATLSHGAAPCEGMSYNRVYDQRTADLEAVLRDSWRPARPDLTDTVCHVVKAEAEGRLLGFISHFGCHPVVCCSESRLIHGDFCGVATNRIEREHPGCVGLFLQGAQGDVNTCVVHRSSQEESLRGLDVLAERYARSVRLALDAARPVAVDRLRCELREAVFRRRPWDLDFLRAMLAEKEAVLAAADASDDAQPVRMATVYAIALRGLIAQREAGRSLEPATEVQGLRIGPIELLASPFEIFQAIKNEVVGQANAPVPWVVGISNDSQGYAPDRNTTPRHAYAADVVPLMCGCVPFADIHTELSRELLALDDALSR